MYDYGFDDGYDGLPPASDDPDYMMGWCAGVRAYRLETGSKDDE